MARIREKKKKTELLEGEGDNDLQESFRAQMVLPVLTPMVSNQNTISFLRKMELEKRLGGGRRRRRRRRIKIWYTSDSVIHKLLK